jgi:hypothetical protein
MSNKLWYEDYQKELETEQATKSREEIKQELVDNSEHVFDPETAPTQNHRWIDRGLKLSCEGANHPNHQAWKRGNSLT